MDGSTSRSTVLLRAAGVGAVAGLAGVAAMTATEQVEQRISGRPDSYVPARALLRLVGREPAPLAQPAGWNHAMHWGTGALVGALRGVWSALGIRGGPATATHTVVRLAFDQTVENLTGAGAPPATWPRSELAVDLLHKGVYGVVTGMITDRLVAPAARSLAGRTSH